jgi:hypothetical protein
MTPRGSQGTRRGAEWKDAVWSRRRMGSRFLSLPPKCQGTLDQTGAIVLCHYP